MHKDPPKQKTSPPIADAGETAHLPAGIFSEWLEGFERSLHSTSENDVACGDCIGCCSSSYFIHIAPADTASLKAIPPEMRVPAPGLPKGHFLLGYDRKGFCPMMKSGKCAIYLSRPTTCRKYDCRVFAAARIDAGGKDKATINAQIKRWAFDYPTQADLAKHEAVKAAARFIMEHRDAFPGGRAPENPSHIALIAVKSCALFLDGGMGNIPRAEIARRIVEIAGKD